MGSHVHGWQININCLPLKHPLQFPLWVSVTFKLCGSINTRTHTHNAMHFDLKHRALHMTMLTHNILK
jgi:hypothetical protein